MKFIATFYSHFGAVRFKKKCNKEGVEAKLMPVPRDLSSSCGTCVSYDSEVYEIEGTVSEELEQVVRQTEDGYEVLYRASDS